MKKIVLLIFFATAFCCTKNTEPEQEFNIVGEWQLIEVFIGNGGSQTLWTTITDGFIYDFKIDGTFARNKSNTNCLEGTYVLNNDILTITTTCSSNGSSSFPYKIRYENGNMILKPTQLFCIEGCSEKYKKV